MGSSGFERREGGLATVSAAVLAGGQSRRMGRDKSRLPVGGVPCGTRVARLLAELFEEVWLVGGDPPPEAPGRRVADGPGPASALRGLVTALETASANPAEHVLVVATDLPFLTPELVLALVAWPEAEAVVPRDAAGPHPLCALYRREPALRIARERLREERLALRGLLDGLDTAYLEGAELASVDPEGRALINLNRPEDLEEAERRLRSSRSSTPAALRSP